MANLVRFLATVFLATHIVACTSPEERIAKHMSTASALLIDGDLVKARLEYRSALQLNDQLPEAWFGLAQIAERQQEWQQALSLANRTVELDPNYREAQTMRGEIFLLAGEYAKALEITQILMTESQSDAAIMALHASVLFRLGQISEAIDLAEQALKQDPTEETATLMLAAAVLQEGDAERALVYLDQGTAVAEPSLPMMLMQIKVLSALGDTDQVEQTYRNAIAKHPTNTALRLRLVNFYLQLFDSEAAEAVMREVVDVNPDDQEMLNRLLSLINQTKGIEAALAEIEERIEAQPANSELRFTQVQLLTMAEEQEAAAAVLETVATTAPDRSDRHRASTMIAQRLLAAGDKTAAMERVDTILAEDSRYEDAVLIRSSVRIEQRELTTAIADLRAVLKDNPSSARALLLLAKAHELDGAIDLADDMYDRAFESSEQAATYGMAYADFLKKVKRFDRAIAILSVTAQRNPKSAEVLAELANLHLQQGDWLTAEQVAQQLKQVEGELESANVLLSKAAVSRAQDTDDLSALETLGTGAASREASMASLVSAYVSDGNVDAALDYLEAVLADDPGNTTAALLQAQVFAVRGDGTNARAAYQTLLQSNETLASVYTSYARYLLSEGETQAALTLLERGVQLNPGSFTLRAILANSVEQSGDYNRAIDLYEQLIEEAPNADPIANNLANLLAEHRTDTGSLQRALSLANRFRQSPVPEFRDTLGWVLFQLARYEDALPLLRGAAADRSSSGVIHYHFARVLEQLGSKERAVEVYETALGLLDDDSELLPSIEETLSRLQPSLSSEAQ